MEANLNLETLVLEKISPLITKIKLLQNSNDEKDHELATLKYALDNLITKFENLKSKRIIIPIEIKLMSIFEKKCFNSFLESIKNESFWPCFDFITLMKMRQVCKKWNTLICKLVLDIYNSSSFCKNQEYREKTIEEIEQFLSNIKNEIGQINRVHLIDIKTLIVPPTLMLKTLEVLFLVMGYKKSDNQTMKDFILFNLRDFNHFINELLKLISPSLSKFKIENVKKYFEENPDLTVENSNKCAQSLPIFLNIVHIKIKYEEYLNEKLGEMKFLLFAKGFNEIAKEVSSKQI